MSNRHQRRADLRCFRHQVHRDHIVTHMVDASADLSAFPSNGNRDPSAKARKRWSGSGSTPELDALPDRIGDRIAPTTDTQEAAEWTGAPGRAGHVDGALNDLQG